MKTIYMDSTISLFLSEGMSEADVNALIATGEIKILPSERKYLVIEEPLNEQS